MTESILTKPQPNVATDRTMIKANEIKYRRKLFNRFLSQKMAIKPETKKSYVVVWRKVSPQMQSRLKKHLDFK